MASGGSVVSKPCDGRRALCVEASVLLWCMRVWVAGHPHAVGPDRRVHEVLARLDAPDAAPCLEEFMAALSRGATRRIAVKPVNGFPISEDERLVLDVFGLAQDARSFEALLRLRGLLRPEDACAALRSAEGIGSALTRAGRFLLAPEVEACRFALAAEAAEAAQRAGFTLD